MLSFILLPFPLNYLKIIALYSYLRLYEVKIRGMIVKMFYSLLEIHVIIPRFFGALHCWIKHLFHATFLSQPRHFLLPCWDKHFVSHCVLEPDTSFHIVFFNQTLHFLLRSSARHFSSLCVLEQNTSFTVAILSVTLHFLWRSSAKHFISCFDLEPSTSFHVVFFFVLERYTLFPAAFSKQTLHFMLCFWA